MLSTKLAGAISFIQEDVPIRSSPTSTGISLLHSAHKVDLDQNLSQLLIYCSFYRTYLYIFRLFCYRICLRMHRHVVNKLIGISANTNKSINSTKRFFVFLASFRLHMFIYDIPLLPRLLDLLLRHLHCTFHVKQEKLIYIIKSEDR